jgi:multiple sugar transport system substrate-binding protein
MEDSMSKRELKLNRREMLKLMGTSATGVALNGVVPFKRPQFNINKAQSNVLSMLSHSSPQTEVYRRAGEAFEEATGIKVEITECPFDELQPKMMTELLAGTGTYDVIPITNAMLYSATNYLETLEDMYTDELVADLPPAGIEHCRGLDGELKAVPTLSSLPANFYRTDLLEDAGMAPPATWDEFVEVSKATTLEATGDHPKIWGALLEGSAKAVQPAVKLVGWFYQAGGGIVGPDNMPTINLDANVTALQFVIDLIHVHKVAPPETSEMIYSDVHNMFIQGRGATAINWQYMVGMANDPEQSLVVDKFAVAPVPAGVTKGVNVDHWVMVVPSDSSNQDAAKEYIKLVLSPEHQFDMFKTEGLCARVSVMDPENVDVHSVNPFIDAWVEELKWATPQPKWKNLNEAWLHLSFAMNSAITKSATPKEALDLAQEEIMALM